MSGAGAILCSCCLPPPPYYLFGRCCEDDGEDHTYWSATVDSGSYVIGGLCYQKNGETNDPADLAGLTPLPASDPCRCGSLGPALNCGSGECVECTDVLIVIEIAGGGFYDLGWWRLTGAEYLWYFDGDDCPRDEAETPPWVGQFGWRCEGDTTLIASLFSAETRYVIKDCDFELPTYPLLTSYSPTDFTWGGTPDC